MALAHLETLESRQFLSGSSASVVHLPEVEAGVLTIKGTAENDRFIITRQNALVISGASGSSSSTVTVIDKDGNTSVISTGVVSSGGRFIQVGDGQFTTIDSGKGDIILLNPNVPAGPYLRIETSRGLIFMQSEGIDAIKVDGGAGDDYIEVAKNVALPATLIGARGNDTLAGGTRKDVISGGEGDDILFDGAGTAADILDTGPGKDLAIQNFKRGTTPNDKLLATLGQDASMLGSFNKLSEAIAVINNTGRKKLGPSTIIDPIG